MRVVLSVRCSLSLCVALTACRSLCMLLRLHIALSLSVLLCMPLSLHVALSACRSFCELLASSDSLDCLSRSALSHRDAFTRASVVAGRVAQPEPDLVPDLGLGPVRRRLSRARNMPCQSGISHNSSAPLTARCVPSRSVSFRLVKSRLAARLFVLFFIYLLFLCELLIYWNTS